MELSVAKRIIWGSVLLLLVTVKHSQQTPEDAIDQLKSLIQDQLSRIDSKLTNVDSQVTNMNTRFESELINMNSRLSNMETTLVQVKDDQEKNNNDTKVANEQISEDLQMLKDKVIYMVENLNNIKVNVNEIKGITNITTDLIDNKLAELGNPELIFESSTISLNAGEDVILTCGVVGMHQSCQWEHNGRIYQLAEVKQGQYEDMIAVANSTNNQCSIKITSVGGGYDGVWTCEVHSFGTTLSASKKICVAPPSYWRHAGSDRFVRFSDYQTWEEARDTCQCYGMDLYRPKDIIKVTEYLEDNFSSDYHWIGSRGNGTHQAWVTGGGVLTRADPWYYDTGYNNIGYSDCVSLSTCCKYTNTRRVLHTKSCNSNYYKYPFICG